MGLIYMRTSPSGGRYIGQTIFTEEKRWEDHTREAYNINNEDYNTILNRAIRKYGPNNFISEILEDNIPDDLLDDKEIYWIDHYKTFYLDNNHGYNMTRGGRGARKIDTEKVFELWNQGLYATEIAKELGTFNETIYKHLKMKGISYEEIRARSHIAIGQKTSERYKNLRSNDLNAVLELWNNGHTILEIMDITQRSYKYITSILNDLNISSEERDKRGHERQKAFYQNNNEKYYPDIEKLWNEGYNIKEIREKLNISQGMVTKGLDKINIPRQDRVNRGIKTKRIPINQYDLNGNFIKEWSSSYEAGNALNINPRNIRAICNGKGKSYKGFIWKNKT